MVSSLLLILLALLFSVRIPLLPPARVRGAPSFPPSLAIHHLLVPREWVLPRSFRRDHRRQHHPRQRVRALLPLPAGFFSRTYVFVSSAYNSDYDDDEDDDDDSHTHVGGLDAAGRMVCRVCSGQTLPAVPVPDPAILAAYLAALPATEASSEVSFL